MSQERVTEAVRGAGIEAPVHYAPEMASTNATALRLAAEGAPEWTVVVAGHQTGGRGRLGRSWISEPGEALLCSVILRPRLTGPELGLLTLYAGVAMAEAARVASGADISCKWPNDLVTAEGKVGGLLAESVVADDQAYVVVGAGVNLRSAPPDVPGAASLGGGDPDVLLSGFLWCLRQRYRPGESGWPQEVVAAARAVSATLGQTVRAEALDGRTVEGIAMDLDLRGNLIVRTGDGDVTVASGEVHHLRPGVA